MKHKLLLIYSWFIRSIFYFFPDIPLCMRIRGFFYGLGLTKCGKDFQVTNDAILKGLENISIGQHVFIGNHTIFFGSGETIVGDNVMFGPHVVVVSGNHKFESDSYKRGKGSVGIIRIEEGSWVGANCTIIAGAFLPKYSILGANSFLSRSYSEQRCIYAGNPAKLIKKIE